MTFHTMRHWFTTNLVRRGVPLGDIAKLTGHKTLTMLLRYGVTDRRMSSLLGHPR
jgi:integrase